ncbi:ankyrin repeat domain-containing protein [Leptospira sp. 96542]|nr:ankyrin repeat domain-containing protein [Leptospira sp. 96542]
MEQNHFYIRKKFALIILLFFINCQSSFQKFVDAMADPTQFKSLTNDVSNINMTDEFGQTLLTHATISNNIEIVSILLDKKIDPKIKDKGSRSALDYAVHYDRLDIFKLILEKNPNLIEDRNFLEGVLLNAVELNKANFVETILIKKNLTNVKLNTTNKFLLHTALDHSNQNKDVIKMIIEKGADVNSIESNGRTPIFRLRSDAEMDCLKYLIEAGANLNHKDSDGHSVMYYWAAIQKFDFIKEILKHGAVPEEGMFVLVITERSYDTTKTIADYQHSESLKYVPENYGGIVSKKVNSTEKVSDENKIPLLDFVQVHDKELYRKLKSLNYK